MPRKEFNDYIFYKIVCIIDDIDLCYIGSTANWKARNHTHKSNCNNENYKEYNSKKYKTIRANGGWENFKMVQVGTRQQLTKRQAEQIEEEYRQELKANMNGKKCFRTEEQKQNYYEANKDKVKEYNQNYYEANKDKVKENQQNYYEANKDKVIEKALEKVKCDCGLVLCKASLLKHQKTQRHLNNMNNI